jgi:hypothetical protein
LKAWSQNLAHKGVLTTLLNYEHVRWERQHEIMRAFDKPHQVTPDIHALAAEVQALKARLGETG